MITIRWTKQEVETLINAYPTTTNSELLKIFKGKTKEAISKKARKLKLSKAAEIRFADRSEAYKTGRKAIVSSKGYILEYCPKHHRADSRGYVLQHILVFEKHTGIQVNRDCIIHHINGDKKDNRIENLCLMSFGAHSAMHNKRRTVSEETKRKISAKTKARMKNKANHPSYKAIDINELRRLKEQGCSVKKICEALKICKSTYYSKLEEL